MMVQKPLAIGYIFFICSSNTQEEEEEEEENCRESQYLQIYTANNSTPLTFILILDKIVVEVCDGFTLLNLMVKGIITNVFFFLIQIWGQFCGVAKLAIIHRKISPFFATS
jgi:hypothetical protein